MYQVKLFIQVKRQFKLDAKAFVDSDEIGKLHRLHEYRFIGRFRWQIIFIPFMYLFIKIKYLYQYYSAFSLVITEMSKSDKLTQLFKVYNINVEKKFSYLAFIAHYSLPDEVHNAEMPDDVKRNLVIHHFQDSAVKLLDDIGATKIIDLLNIDSLSDTTLLEMHLEPLGMYELIALKEIKMLVSLTTLFIHLPIVLLILRYLIIT